VRALATLLLLATSLGGAPVQCASEPDSELRRYETPGEALYDLAKQFKAKGDAQAWRGTLEYLIARYPNSRHAHMAKDDLAGSSAKE
jgi:TolA-binding protein